jgi:dCMP deaminase
MTDNFEPFDKFNRPSFDLWFMTLAFLTSQRSLDPATKHGTVVVDDSKTVLAMGYNSPPRGCVDEAVPLTRPEKYLWMAHSEINAISNAARTGVALEGSTFYVTGTPCAVCFRSILNSGAKRLVYGPINAKCVETEDEKVKDHMINDGLNYGKGKRDFTVEYFDGVKEISDLLSMTSGYMFDKIASQ